MDGVRRDDEKTEVAMEDESNRLGVSAEGKQMENAKESVAQTEGSGQQLGQPLRL